MIYTSYFSYYKRVPNPIAISRSIPLWYDGDIYKDLAPSYEILNKYKKNEITSEEYEILYCEELKLKGINADKIIEYLPKNCTLLCWETPLSFCHRHIISSLLRNSGYESREWTPDDENQTTEKKKISTRKTNKRRTRSNNKSKEDTTATEVSES